jgi:hypothetical protein
MGREPGISEEERYVSPSDEHRISNGELSRLVYKHDKDLYVGNGKPGLTARVLLLEEAMAAIRFYGRWLLVTLGGILVVTILNLVIKK